MIAKKPGVLLATCNCLQSVPLSPASKSSTSSPPVHRTRKRLHSFQTYATVAGNDSSGHAAHAEQRRQSSPRDSPEDRPPQKACHAWPSPLKGHSHPTPYQIFALKPGTPYSKARFYELVKLYHPDLTSASTKPNASVPHSVRVERYRLIVAAHAILSDPSKRSAYDRFGAGWNGRAEFGRSGSSSSGPGPGPFTHSWSDPGDPIWRNATWEDWERFYARRAQENGGGGGGGGSSGRRAPVYMANSHFLALLVVLAVAGSSFNYGRAQDAGTYFVEQRDIVHDRAAKELRRVRLEASSLASKEDRIEFFVRQREATMGLSPGDAEALRDEKAGRLLPDREICRSEELKERDIS